jgi:tetratricopeptide (TPR) repeat protein
MTIVGFKNILCLVGLGAFLLLIAGCAGLVHHIPAEPLTLTSAEKGRLGEVIETRLLQMLGGPYHDLSLTTALKRACLDQSQRKGRCKLTVADLSSPALYPLPGGHLVLTRGLLAEITSDDELSSLLEKGVALAANVYEDHATREMNEAMTAQLAGHDSKYDPDAADIRLARLFKDAACEEECLALSRAASTGKSGVTRLPDSVKRLAILRPGYELLSKARDFEKQGDEARSIATYLQAATASPDEPRILRALGMAYLRAGQLQSARLHLQKAVKLQPDYYRSRMGLGYLYLKKGHLRQASQELAESVSLLPVTENLFLLAEVREKSGDLKEAMALYTIIVEADPDSKLGRSSASRLAQATGGQ